MYTIEKFKFDATVKENIVTYFGFLYKYIWELQHCLILLKGRVPYRVEFEQSIFKLDNINPLKVSDNLNTIIL